MNFKYPLYLASNSASRKMLLTQAKIPFTVIRQTADETTCCFKTDIADLVKELAVLKMESVIMPEASKENEICLVLTADTLNFSSDKEVLGKPVDRDDAIAMLRKSRAGNIVATGFCIRKMKWNDGQWNILEEVADYDQALCVMDIPEEFLDYYLDTVPHTSVSGGIAVEDFGTQFCKKIEGSYGAIVGLPVYKVRKVLYELGFYQQ